MPFFITDNCVGCDTCVKFCPVDAIYGEKKEVHVVNEDECIECGVCGKVCPKSAIEDSYGIPCVKVNPKEWKKPQFDLAICTSCQICSDTCPVSCIGMTVPGDQKVPREFPYLENEKECIGCGFCADDCPVNAITLLLTAEVA